MLLNQFSAPEDGVTATVSSIDDIDILQSMLQTSHDARERSIIRSAIHKLRAEQAGSSPQRTNWKRKSKRHGKFVEKEHPFMNGHANESSMSFTGADLKSATSFYKQSQNLQRAHDFRNHDSVFRAGNDYDKNSSPFVRDSVSRRNRRSRKSTSSSQSSSMQDAQLEDVSATPSLPECDDKCSQATNEQNSRDFYRRSNDSTTPGCNSLSGTFSTNRNSVATPFAKQSVYKASTAKSGSSAHLQYPGKTSVTYVQGATCKYKTISTQFESPARLNRGDDSVKTQYSDSSECSSTLEDRLSRTAPISSYPNYRTESDSESRKQSAKIKLIALGKKLFSGNSKSPTKVGQNSTLSHEGKFQHTYNTCGSREEVRPTKSSYIFRSNSRSELVPTPKSSTLLPASHRNDSSYTAYLSPKPNSLRDRNSAGLGSVTWPRSTMTECANDTQSISHEASTKVASDRDPLRLRDDRERIQESPVEELEKLLKVYKDPSQVEKIRHTIEGLKKSLQEDEESKRSVPDIGGESASLDVSSKVNRTSYINIQQHFTEPNTATYIGKKVQESTDSPSEHKATLGFLSTPLSSFVGRSESLRSPKPTYQLTPHAVSRANSLKLSRPKDFISKTTASSPFLKLSNSNSDKNLTRSQSLYTKTSPASFLATRVEVESSSTTLGPGAHTRSAVSRSESCKENPRSEIRAIPIVQGNVRRSKSILGRILGQRIDFEKAAPQEPVEVRSIYSVGKEPIIFPPKSVRVETTSPLKSQVISPCSSVFPKSSVDTQLSQAEDERAESFQGSDNNVPLVSSSPPVSPVKNDSDFEKEEVVENISVSSKSASTSSEDSESSNTSSNPFTVDISEIVEETTAERDLSSEKGDQFHSTAIAEKESEPDLEYFEDELDQEVLTDKDHKNVEDNRSSSLSCSPHSHSSTENGKSSPKSVTSENVLETKIVPGSVAVFEVEIVQQIVSSESESEDSLEEFQEEEESMDRYSARVIKSRVNVRSQVLATEGGSNINNNVSPSKNASDRRKIPLTSGDDVKTRIQKYKGKLGPETKDSPTKRGRKSAQEAETKNGNVDDKNGNIEISRDSNITVVTITTTAPAAASLQSVVSSPGSTSSGENGSKTRNLSSSSQDYDSERPRRSRRRKELEVSCQSKADASTKTGAIKLEEASVVSIAELNEAHAKQYGEITIKTKSNRQRATTRSQAVSKSEEVVPSSASSENTIDAVENSLSNWSNRRRKKRDLKDIDTATSSENASNVKSIGQDNESSADTATVRTPAVQDIELSQSSYTVKRSKDVSETPNAAPNDFEDNTTLTLDSPDVCSTTIAKDALNEKITSSNESEESEKFYDAEDDTYANTSAQDETAVVKDDVEEGSLGAIENISNDLSKGEMDDEDGLNNREGGARFQPKLSDYREKDIISEIKDDEIFEKGSADNDEQKDNSSFLQEYTDMNDSEKKESSDKNIFEDDLLNVETVVKISTTNHSTYEDSSDKPSCTEVTTVVEEKVEQQALAKSRVSSKGKLEIEQEPSSTISHETDVKAEDRKQRTHRSRAEDAPSHPPRRHRRHRKDLKEGGERVESEKPKSRRRHRDRIENEDITPTVGESEVKLQKEDVEDNRDISDNKEKESKEGVVDKSRRHHKGRKDQHKNLVKEATKKESSGADDRFVSEENEITDKAERCADQSTIEDAAVDKNIDSSSSEHKNTEISTESNGRRKQIAESGLDEVKTTEKTAELELHKGEADLEGKEKEPKEKENTEIPKVSDSNQNVSESTQVQSGTSKEPENMRSPLDNVEEITDQKLLEKMLDNAEEYEDRKRIRSVLRALRKGIKPTPPVDMGTLKVAGSYTSQAPLKSQSRNGVLPGDNVKGSISVLTSVSHTSREAMDLLRKSRLIRWKEMIDVDANEGSDSWKKTTSIKAERTMTSGSKKIGSIFDREDDPRTTSRTSGSSRFSDLERRQMERKRELQRNRSMPAASSKDARKAFVAKLEAESGQKSGKKVGRSPTFVVPNANNVKQMLLKWCQSKTRGYDHVDIVNFSGSWASGMAFCALVHNFFPEAFNYDELDPKNRAHNFDLAFKTAEEYADATPLLEVEDMLIMGNRPDSKCVFTYAQSLYNHLRKFEKPLVSLDKAPPKSSPANAEQ